MSNSALQSFDFNSTAIRVVMIEGDPWFVAKDVAVDILEMRDAVVLVQRLPEKVKGTFKVCTPGGEQEVLCINEQGLYTAVLRSNKPQAERFMDWVSGEVLPSIRKTGQYAVPSMSPAEQLLAQAQMLVKLEADQKALAARQEELAEAIEKKGCGTGYYPVAAFAMKYDISVSISEARRIGRVAGKKCRAQGIKIGEVPDERWYKVNSYPEEILVEAFRECDYSVTPQLKLISS